jgi:succinate-acetate transporter protein
MFVGTLRLNRALQVVFGTLVLLFVLLAIRDITGNAVIVTITGYEGIICGLSAIYASLAQIWNSAFGRTVDSLGQVN